MFDIADKEKLVQRIMGEVGFVNVDLSQNSHDTLHTVSSRVEYAIQDYGERLVKAIVDHLYTNQEFEDDVGLSSR
jgi:hypothetical protein